MDVAELLQAMNDRIEALLRCGLGGWLVDEFAADRAFLSPLA